MSMRLGFTHHIHVQILLLTAYIFLCYFPTIFISSQRSVSKPIGFALSFSSFLFFSLTTCFFLRLLLTVTHSDSYRRDLLFQFVTRFGVTFDSRQSNVSDSQHGMFVPWHCTFLTILFNMARNACFSRFFFLCSCQTRHFSPL